MGKKKAIFSGSEKECLKFKKDTYIYMGSALAFIIFWEIFNFLMYDIILIPDDDISVNLLFVFSVGGILLIIVGIGFKINLFGVYEKGISPPAKPWSKVFSKYYFIPYNEIQSVNIDNAPMYYELHLKGGRIIPMRTFPLYKFISEKQSKNVEKYMKKIHDFIANENEKEMRGEKTDWIFEG